jgi:hypothetical protein
MSPTVHVLLLSLFLVPSMAGSAQVNLGELGKDAGEKMVKDAKKEIKTLTNTAAWQKKAEEVVSRKMSIALDSLTKILVAKGKVCLDTAQYRLASLLKYPLEDSINLANLTFSVPGSKTPMSYPYKVEANDTLGVRFEHTNGWEMEQFRISADGEVVFAATNLKKGRVIQERVVAKNAGTIMIEVVNRGYLPAHAKLLVTLFKKNKETVVVEKSDTLYVEEKEMVTLTDTIAEYFLDNTRSINPKMDITRPPNLQFQLTFPKLDQTIGWAYWVGVGNRTATQYSAVAAGGMDPLEAFARGRITMLPENRTADVKIAFCDKNNTDRFLRGTDFQPYPLGKSANSRDQYAFVKANTADYAKRPIHFAAVNTSSLYDYPVLVKALVLYTQQSIVEVNLKKPVIHKSLEVTTR